MENSKLSKEQLISKIEELEIINEQLLKEKEQETRLEYAWTGNLGHWYWNVKTNAVTFDPLKIETLGYSMDELPEVVSYQFFTDKLHPEDFGKTMDAMRDHLSGITSVYESEYRIKAKDGSYRWYYDRGKITKTDDSGKPVFLAGVVFDVTQKKEMQLELEEKNKILEELSSTDGLTKIFNHRVLLDHLNEQIKAAQKTGVPFTVAMFDLDDFKKVNDTKGHIYGDKVLRDVAALITGNIRKTDFAGRYGGEEFMVIFPDTSVESAAIVCERIRSCVEDSGHSITISGGLAMYRAETQKDIIHEADMNLYKAKKSGKNRIIY